MGSGWSWGVQAQLQWSVPMLWPDTSALPSDGCLQSWTGSLEPSCPRPSGCRTPGFHEVVLRPFPQLHPRAGDLQEKAMSWEAPGKRHWWDVAGRFGGWEGAAGEVASCSGLLVPSGALSAVSAGFWQL